MEEDKLTFCGQQVKRLISKAFFPSSDDAQLELLYVLDSHTKSKEHARRVIDAAIVRKFGRQGQQEDRCPGPADLMELCLEITPSALKNEALPTCVFCEGNGFEDGPRGGVQRCRCGGFPMSDESRMAYYRSIHTPPVHFELSIRAKGI